MSAAQHAQTVGLAPQGDRRAPPSGEGFLTLLRIAALACRAKPRAELFRACALLATDPTASHMAHAEALMRCLPEALGRRPRIHAPGAVERSFDEAWLARLGQASAEGDRASVSFLLRARVAKPHQRAVGYLIARSTLPDGVCP